MQQNAHAHPRTLETYKQEGTETNLSRISSQSYITFSAALRTALLNLLPDDDSWGGDFFIPLIFGEDARPPELEKTEH